MHHMSLNNCTSQCEHNKVPTATVPKPDHTSTPVELWENADSLAPLQNLWNQNLCESGPQLGNHKLLRVRKQKKMLHQWLWSHNYLTGLRFTIYKDGAFVTIVLGTGLIS